jgi:hypothetical protein
VIPTAVTSRTRIFINDNRFQIHKDIPVQPLTKDSLYGLLRLVSIIYKRYIYSPETPCSMIPDMNTPALIIYDTSLKRTFL